MSGAGKRLRGLKGAEWTEASPLNTGWAEPTGGGDTGPGQAWGSEGHPWAEAQTSRLSLWEGKGGSRTHQDLISQQLGGHPSTAHSDLDWQAVVWGERGRHGERSGLGPPHNADRTNTHLPPERQEGGTHTPTHVNSKHSGACNPQTSGPTSLT